MTDLSNALADLAERVKEATAVSAAAARTSVEKAAEAGFLLCQAKEEGRHGEWLPFLNRAGIPERQAQRLMKIARAGLNPSSLSDLGGVKGALDYIAQLTLPEPGDILFVSTEDDRGNDVPLRCAWIEPDLERPGYFHITAVDGDRALQTTKPVSADLVVTEEAFACGVWLCLDEMLPIAPVDREFVIMPAEMLQNDTFEFLGELDDAIDVSQAIPHARRMPPSYEHALAALTACIESFSLRKAKVAWRAVSALEAKLDKWPGGPEMIPVFHRAASGEIDHLVKAVKLLVMVNHPELFDRGAT